MRFHTEHQSAVHGKLGRCLYFRCLGRITRNARGGASLNLRPWRSMQLHRVPDVRISHRRRTDRDPVGPRRRPPGGASGRPKYASVAAPPRPTAIAPSWRVVQPPTRNPVVIVCVNGSDSGLTTEQNRAVATRFDNALRSWRSRLCHHFGLGFAVSPSACPMMTFPIRCKMSFSRSFNAMILVCTICCRSTRRPRSSS